MYTSTSYMIMYSLYGESSIVRSLNVDGLRRWYCSPCSPCPLRWWSGAVTAFEAQALRTRSSKSPRSKLKNSFLSVIDPLNSSCFHLNRHEINENHRFQKLQELHTIALRTLRDLSPTVFEGKSFASFPPRSWLKEWPSSPRSSKERSTLRPFRHDLRALPGLKGARRVVRSSGGRLRR